MTDFIIPRHGWVTVDEGLPESLYPDEKRWARSRDVLTYRKVLGMDCYTVSHVIFPYGTSDDTPYLKNGYPYWREVEFPPPERHVSNKCPYRDDLENEGYSKRLLCHDCFPNDQEGRTP